MLHSWQPMTYQICGIQRLRMPYRADFEPEDIEKRLYFAFRWLNTRGESGP